MNKEIFRVVSNTNENVGVLIDYTEYCSSGNFLGNTRGYRMGLYKIFLEEDGSEPLSILRYFNNGIKLGKITYKREGNTIYFGEKWYETIYIKDETIFICKNGKTEEITAEHIAELKSKYDLSQAINGFSAVARFFNSTMSDTLYNLLLENDLLRWNEYFNSGLDNQFIYNK